MPELPEVETSRLGIKPYVEGHKVTRIILRRTQLRWPIPSEIRMLEGHEIDKVKRRGKYLLLESKVGTAIIHLGMSGSLYILPQNQPPEKHDHFDIVFNDYCLRYRDPRRFGALLWTRDNPLQHKLLKTLGPEPLHQKFSSNYLWPLTQKSSRSIKLLIMDSHIVVGVGNIYANEALYSARIDPRKAAHLVSSKHIEALVNSIKVILRKAIKAGGTTLKDFSDSSGKPGYFQQQLFVYGRENKPCLHCKKPLTQSRLGQRTTVYCEACQQ